LSAHFIGFGKKVSPRTSAITKDEILGSDEERVLSGGDEEKDLKHYRTATGDINHTSPSNSAVEVTSFLTVKKPDKQR
jgi:hypothetical protein